MSIFRRHFLVTSFFFFLSILSFSSDLLVFFCFLFSLSVITMAKTVQFFFFSNSTFDLRFPHGNIWSDMPRVIKKSNIGFWLYIEREFTILCEFHWKSSHFSLYAPHHNCLFANDVFFRSQHTTIAESSRGGSCIVFHMYTLHDWRGYHPKNL